MLCSMSEGTIIPYCQTWNLQFAEEMQGRLPVELRNMICQYLWDGDTFAAFPDLQKVAGGSRSVDDSRSKLTLPLFIDPKYVGLTTARETVRAFYNAVHLTRHMIIVHRPEHIKAAVTQDVFRVGLDPSVHLISSYASISIGFAHRAHNTSSRIHVDIQLPRKSTRRKTSSESG